ncbi:MAG TPA: hypothetical protein PKW35_00670 [Nannocystaceae bacterium]|nr:hypothetical protein [Nannocystaceae bacterium]
MKHNPETLCKPASGLPPAAYSANPTTEAFVDTRGWSECLVILHCGTFTSTATLDVAMHESTASNGSGSTAITSAAFAQVSTANDDAVYVGRINLQDRLRYIGSVCTYGGSGNAVASMVIIPIGPRDTALCDQTYSFSVGD